MDQTSPAEALPEEMLSADMIERLQQQPWRFGFLSLMRRIGANPRIDPIGKAQLPSAEPFSLGQKPSLIFAPS
ncbi:type VI secretion system protein ImpH, partial [Paraburkholderia lycopersici]